MRKFLLWSCDRPVQLVVGTVLVGLMVGAANGGVVSRIAEAGAAAPDNGRLVVTLGVDKSTYGVQEQMTLQVLLTNRSKDPIYLYAPLEWGQSASLSLWLKDAASGKSVPQEFVADALPPPPSSRDEFMKLPPGYIYGVTLVVPLSELNLKARGVYEVVVQYHSPIPATMGFGLPIWSRASGAVSSNPVVISVRSPDRK